MLRVSNPAVGKDGGGKLIPHLSYEYLLRYPVSVGVATGARHRWMIPPVRYRQPRPQFRFPQRSSLVEPESYPSTVNWLSARTNAWMNSSVVSSYEKKAERSCRCHGALIGVFATTTL